MKFEYKILNLSEVDKLSKADKTRKTNFISVINDWGAQGWELMFKFKDSSYIFKRVTFSSSELGLHPPEFLKTAAPVFADLASDSKPG